MNAQRAWLCLVAGLLLACGATPPPPTADVEPLIGVWYTVKSGDTAASVAQVHDVPLDDIIELNGLVSPDQLKVGQTLFLYGIETLLARRPEARPAEPKIDNPAAKPAEPVPPTTPPPVTGPPPFRWPMKAGVISSGFGRRRGRPHKGLDVAAKSGTSIYAAAAGKVIYSDNKQRGYGNLVIIRHVRGYVTVYAHNRRNLVDEGERVRQGAKIAEVGSTGRSTGPHLHFEIREGGKAVDPLVYLPAR